VIEASSADFRSPQRANAVTHGASWRRWRWVVLFAGWTLFGLAQGVLRNVLTIPQLERAALQVVLLYLPTAWLWAALTPVIGWWSRRINERFSSVLARIAAHVPFFLATSLASAVLRRTMQQALGVTGETPFYLLFLFGIDLYVIAYIAAVWAARALDAMDLAVESERRRLALQEELTRAQMEYLELQLRPHFLFNALGAITTLAHEAPQSAARMLRSLTRLLEIAVSRQGKGLVSLADEITALEHYLAIQRVRFSDWLTIERTVDAGAEQAMVPQFILQPLVENAVHHGLMQRSASGLIAIRASVQGDRLRVTVCDNGVGLQKESYRASRGIGLENIRARLRTVYGEDATLTLGDEPGGGTSARLDIPLRLSPQEMPAAATTAAEPTPQVAAASSASDSSPTRVSPFAIIAIALALVVMRVQRSMAWEAMGFVLNDPMPSVPLRDDLLLVFFWLPLAPVIWWVARQFPLQRSAPSGAGSEPGWARMAMRVFVHLGVAYLVVTAHMYLIKTPSIFFHVPLFRFARAEVWSWDVSIYGILLAAAHYRQLESWLRGWQLADDRLKRELQQARFDNVMLELRPRVLFDALRRVEDSLTRDARVAERTLAEIAAFLRHTLDTIRQRTMSLRAESEALAAYARVLVAASAPGLEVRVELPETLAGAPVPNGLLRAVLDSALGGGERLTSVGRTSIELRITRNGGGPSIAAVASEAPRGNTVLPSRQLQEYASQGLVDVTASGQRLDVHIREAVSSHR